MNAVQKRASAHERTVQRVAGASARGRRVAVASAGPRARTRRRPAPVEVRRMRLANAPGEATPQAYAEAWRTALKLAGGDAHRITRHEDCLVVANPITHRK